MHIKIHYSNDTIIKTIFINHVICEIHLLVIILFSKLIKQGLFVNKEYKEYQRKKNIYKLLQKWNLLTVQCIQNYQWWSHSSKDPS